MNAQKNYLFNFFILIFSASILQSSNQDPLNRALRAAVMKELESPTDDFYMIEALINAGADINHNQGLDMPPLLQIVISYKNKLPQDFLDYKYDYDSSRTRVDLHFQLASFLLKKGADSTIVIYWRFPDEIKSGHKTIKNGILGMLLRFFIDKYNSFHDTPDHQIYFDTKMNNNNWLQRNGPHFVELLKRMPSEEYFNDSRISEYNEKIMTRLAELRHLETYYERAEFTATTALLADTTQRKNGMFAITLNQLLGANSEDLQTLQSSDLNTPIVDFSDEPEIIKFKHTLKLKRKSKYCVLQ